MLTYVGLFFPGLPIGVLMINTNRDPSSGLSLPLFSEKCADITNLKSVHDENINFDF